jgi:hypothetical protein
MAHGFKKLKRIEQFEIGKLFETITESDGVDADGSKFTKYIDGWDDHKVAAHFPHFVACTSKSVAGLRQELRGKLRPVGRAGPGDLAELRDLVTSLQRRIIELETWAHDRPVKPFMSREGRGIANIR